MLLPSVQALLSWYLVVPGSLEWNAGTFAMLNGLSVLAGGDRDGCLGRTDPSGWLVDGTTLARSLCDIADAAQRRIHRYLARRRYGHGMAPRRDPDQSDRPMYVRLPSELHEAVKGRATEEDRTMAQTIRVALRYYLANTSPLAGA